MSEKTIVVEQGACYTFLLTPQIKSGLIFHTADGDIDLEYSLKNKTFSVSGILSCLIRSSECNVEDATAVLVALKNWNKQFPSPNTLKKYMVLHNINQALGSVDCNLMRDVDGN